MKKSLIVFSVFFSCFFSTTASLNGLGVEDLLYNDNDLLGESSLFIGGVQTRFVSLGSLCEPALTLRAIQYRKRAFPFDWVVSVNQEGFLKCLNEDFLFFTDEDCFSQRDGVPYFNNFHYDMGFIHDFDSNEWDRDKGLEQWSKFKKKYTRRIQQFRDLREYKGKVFFVRAWWTQPTQGTLGEFNENTILSRKLKDALDRYFPDLEFELIILSYLNLDIPEMEEIEGVIEFRVERSHEAFKNKVEELLLERQLIR